MASSRMEFLALGTGPFPPILSVDTPLCVIHQSAVFHLPAPVQHRPGEGPVVGARYNSLDILFKVLEGLVPPDPCKEVSLGSFF